MKPPSAQVIFLEVYEREAARAKLQFLVLSGLHAYFAHKVHSTLLHCTFTSLNCSLASLHCLGVLQSFCTRGF